MSEYPSWVCTPCAKAAGAKWPEGHVATFHQDQCGVCLKITEVTQPRDWGYPKFKMPGRIQVLEAKLAEAEKERDDVRLALRSVQLKSGECSHRGLPDDMECDGTCNASKIYLECHEALQGKGDLRADLLRQGRLEGIRAGLSFAKGYSKDFDSVTSAEVIYQEAFPGNPGEGKEAENMKTPKPAEAGVCKRCHGTGSVNGPCPDADKYEAKGLNCLVRHLIPCPACGQGSGRAKSAP